MSHSRNRGGRTLERTLGRARWLGTGWVPLAYFVSSFACSEEGGRPRELGNDPGLHHGTLDAGTSPGENPAETGDGGVELAPDAGAGASDAGSPDAVPPTCGNALIDPAEDCDTALPQTESCVLRGFDTGVLGCDVQCHFTTTSCSGTESCYDGRDNDGDTAVDCLDADCALPCTNACLAPPLLAESSTIYGTTSGHAAALASSCSDAEPSGREVAYQLDISADAQLDVVLSSNQNLNVSLRSTCDDLGTELACGAQTRLTRSVYAGETYFIVVDGAASEDVGDYVLDVQTRPLACGDGVRDAGEECDDGNINDGDGCDPDCNLETLESEPNDVLGQADAYSTTPWFAQIGSEGDVDYFAVAVNPSSATLVVSTQNLGDGACGYNLMDTVVDVFDTNARGNVLRGTDDDGGDGKCSVLIVRGVTAGTYYVRARAKNGAVPDTFPYRLDVSVVPCGDGDVDFGEECDDQNLASGDGCDWACRLEAPQ